MTIRNDARTLVAIARAFEMSFTNRSLLEDVGYRLAMLIQPISLAQLKGATSGNSGNMMGLDEEMEPLLCKFDAQLFGCIVQTIDTLIVLSFEVRWSLSILDEAHTLQINGFLDYCKEFIASKHHTLHPFVYLNYAAAGQDVFELLRSQDRLTELKAIRKKYDEKGYLENHLSNPFRLRE